MNGGGGYTPAQVGAMTLDQAFMRLMDIDILKGKAGVATPVPITRAGGGNVKVRTEDGELIELKSSGPHGSLASRIRAEIEAKRAAEEAAAKTGGRKRRRK